MKTRFLLSLFFLFVINHPGKCMLRGNNDSTMLLQFENSLAKCYVQFDAKTFDKLVAKDFIYSENDQTYSREQVVKQLSATTEKIESAQNEDLHVYLYGSTALITGWLVIKGKNAEGAFERHYRFTDVWMKKKGGWQIIGAHDFIR